jgi:proteasome assembly chaperone (PAC2) family protein
MCKDEIMTLLEQWMEGFSCLEQNSLLFVAFPGVGNVGKCAIEEILALNMNEEVLRLHPVGLPPLAELDDQGLLSPPHIKVHRIHLSCQQALYTLSGPSQPNQAIEQSMLARQILEFAKKQNIERICVFAGLMDEPERKETFAVATTIKSRQHLLEKGVDVRIDEPRSGAIGVSALITSLGPVYNLDSCCVISSTIGTSKDTMSALRLLRSVDTWFQLNLTIPNEDMLNLRLRSKLSDVDPGQTDFIKEMTSHDTSYM